MNDPAAPPRSAAEAQPEATRPSPAEASTTSSEVREFVTALDGIENRPLSEHADRYAAVHAELQSALTSLDDASG